MSGSSDSTWSDFLDAVTPRAACTAVALSEIHSSAALDGLIPESPATSAVLLESTLPGPRAGRWSFLADRPRAVIALRRRPSGTRLTLQLGVDASPRSLDVCLSPFEAIAALLRRIRHPHLAVPRSAPPWIGGLAGYLGYELLHDLERIPDGPANDLDLPECVLLAADSLIARDELSGVTQAVAIGRGAAPGAAVAAARALAEELAARADAGLTHASRQADAADHPDAIHGAPPDLRRWRLSMPPATHRANVEEIRRRIARGDLYQANLTFRLSMPSSAAPAALHRMLRRTNPAPQAALLRLPELSVVCCSPERFLLLDADGRVETRPIKGTRPRGPSPAADAALHDALLRSDKDRAEHSMIVDLLRNDLGRVCEFGSIDVPEVMVLEPYATCWQMVSTVTGRLAPGRDAADLLCAAFPGGSMTGAPKIAAMKLIAELEPVRRGVYSGCLGYFDVRGGCDLNIVIRTLVQQAGMAHVHAGGGIVADSQPETEFAEAMIKAAPLLRAVEAMRTPDRAAQPTPV